MRLFKIIIAVLLVTAMAGIAQAQLPGNLTPIGAEKAGNKEGTIPAWTGGYTGQPAGFVKGSGNLVDPFAGDKMLFTITAQNMDKYADRLTDGLKALLKKYPTFRMDVYQTRRSASYTQSFVDNTVKNMTRCMTKDGGLSLDTSKGCGQGIPFPIAKTGQEAMWNHFARPVLPAFSNKGTAYYVKATGEIVIPNVANFYWEAGLYDPSRPNTDRYASVRVEYPGPARIAGQTTIYYDDVDVNIGRRAYTYQPATRRVRLAPDIAADSPVPTVGGAVTYDDGFLFGSGKMDRFDFELKGKKEIYIPYNNYRINFANAKQQLHAGHVNPDFMRWELHRVWVIEATLKPGKRHVYSKRIFYFDEDSYTGGILDNYDAGGKIYRTIFSALTPNYEFHAASSDETYHDLISGIYYKSIWVDGCKPVKILPRTMLTPESMSTHILK